MKLHILTLSWQDFDDIKKLGDTLYKNIKYAIYNNDNTLKKEYDKPKWYIKNNNTDREMFDKIQSYLDNFEYKEEIDVLIQTKIIENNILQKNNSDNFARGVNYLINKTNAKCGDLILLLNSDVEFLDDFSLNNMITLMNSDTNIGVVGSRLLYPNTNKLQHAGVIFSDKYAKMPYHFRPNEESDKLATKNKYFQAVTAACCLIKWDDLLKLEYTDGEIYSTGELKKKYLDERYFWAFEDIDMCLKIGQTKKIAYCGNVNIVHFSSKSLIKNPVNKLFMSQNVNLFKKIWFGKYKIDHDLYLKNQDYNDIKL